MKARLLLAVAALFALPACLDPIVGTQCARGYSPCGNTCVRAGTCGIGDAGTTADDASSLLVDGSSDETQPDAGVDEVETDVAVDSESGPDGNEPDAGADDVLPPEDAGLGDDGGQVDMLAPTIDASFTDANIDGPEDAPSDAQAANLDAADDDVAAVAINDALAPEDAGRQPDLDIADAPVAGDTVLANDAPRLNDAVDGPEGDSRLLCLGCPDSAEAGETGEVGDAGDAGETSDGASDVAHVLLVDSGVVDGADTDGGTTWDAIPGEVDGGFADASPLECVGRLTACAGQCVDLTSDPDNCGGCSTVCASPHVCLATGCLVCAAGETYCGGRRCVNTASDPDNCGGCGASCASGLCSSSQCEASGTGRVIVIGHDYLVNRPTINEVLGNAVFLWPVVPVHLLAYQGTANPTAIAGADTAIAQVATGRQVTRTYLEDGDDLGATLKKNAVDVFLIYGQEGASSDTTLQQLGQQWADAMKLFVNGGGTVIVLDGYYSANSGTVQIINQTGLFNIQRNVSASGARCTVAAAARGDALASGLTSEYLCEANSVNFTTTDPATVVVESGSPVVLYKLSPF
jgi:hypothetical protein